MIVAAAGVATMLLGIVIVIATDRGYVKISCDDPTAVVQIDGKTIRVEGIGEPITLRAGEHVMTVKRGDLETLSRRFTMKRGMTESLKVEMNDGFSGMMSTMMGGPGMTGMMGGSQPGAIQNDGGMGGTMAGPGMVEPSKAEMKEGSMGGMSPMIGGMMSGPGMGGMTSMMGSSGPGMRDGMNESSMGVQPGTMMMGGSSMGVMNGMLDGTPAGEIERPSQALSAETSSAIDPRGIRLLNGRDLTGWKGEYKGKTADPTMLFRVAGEELVWTGTSGRISLDRPARDFAFKFEYFIPVEDLKAPVSLGLPSCTLIFDRGGRYEVGPVRNRVVHVNFALIDGMTPLRDALQSGDATLFEAAAGKYHFIQRKNKAELTPGRWNEGEVICDGRSIRFRLNGREVNRLEVNREVVGSPGFGSSGGPLIHYRNVRLTPLGDRNAHQRP